MRFSPIQFILSFFRRCFFRPEVSQSLQLPPVSRRDLERLVGMSVGDLTLYQQALLHRSMLRGRPNTFLFSNERLEFLGDAALGFIMAEHLYQQFPEEDEGFLTRLRAKLVNGKVLADYAKRVGLGRLILLSENMDQVGGRDNPTILADAFEAIIGALYLDKGEEAARIFIEKKILKIVNLEDLAEQQDNFKSILLEYAQAKGWPQPQYRVTREEGPSHDKRFTVEVLVKEIPYGQGRAGNKKKAEQRAAQKALQSLEEDTETEGEG